MTIELIQQLQEAIRENPKQVLRTVIDHICISSKNIDDELYAHMLLARVIIEKLCDKEQK